MTEQPRTQKQKLSVIVPVYNEQYTLRTLIEKVLRVELPDGILREIVIIDDASTDESWDLIEKLASAHQTLIKTHRQSVNRGKGAALRKGIELATGDIIVFQDADLEYDPAYYANLLEPILAGDADVVYGSRFAGSEIRRVLLFWHAVGNQVLTLFSNMLTNLNLTDMETGYKMARSQVLKSIPIRCERFGVEPELTAKFAKRHCRIYEVPISYHGRTYAEGKKITWWDGVKAFATILRFYIIDDVYNETHGHDILHRLSKTLRFNGWMADTIRPWVGQHVLEIGAGLGNITRDLLPRKQYVTSDIDPIYLDFLSNHFSGRSHVTVEHINLEQASDFDVVRNQIDTVVCLNVLEHVEQDEAALRHMYDALKPGGRAIILVPYGQKYFGTLDQILGHFRRYSPESLSALGKQAGFEVEKILSFNRIGVPGWILNAKILNRRGFGKLQLKFYDSMVWFWRLIDRWLPWAGLSVILIARKPMTTDAT